MQNQRKRVELSESVGPTKRFVFVLLERFSMLSFASAVECLRIANRMSGRELYSWSLLAEGGETVTCSAGTTFQLDGDLSELQRDDTILLCAGIDVQGATSKKLLSWLRREAR
jgi:transcriptional regulator GlxA family with amidase domain